MAGKSAAKKSAPMRNMEKGKADRMVDTAAMKKMMGKGMPKKGM